MKMKWIVVVLLTALLLIAAPLAADDAPARKANKAEVYRTAILEQAKLDINVFKEQLKGGRADGRAVTDFPLDQLIKGIHTEREHTSNPMLALEIAMDHLAKRPHYYSHLEIMESGHAPMGMHTRGMTAHQGHGEAMKAGGGHKCSGNAQSGDGHKCPGNAEAGGGHKCSGSAQSGGEHKCSGTEKAGGDHKCPGNAQSGDGHKCSGDCSRKSATPGKAQPCAAAEKTKKTD